MCMIFACFSGHPKEDILGEAWGVNNDGGGIAWVDEKEKTVRWEKGMDLEAIAKAVNKKPPFPYLVHMRSASIGSAIPELSHPFPLVEGIPLDLSGSAPAVLAHNGTWHGYADHLLRSVYGSGAELPDGEWSDSRGIAYLAWKHGLRILDFIQDKMRIAVLRWHPDRKWRLNHSLWGTWYPTLKEGEKGPGFLYSAPRPGVARRWDFRKNEWEEIVETRAARVEETPKSLPARGSSSSGSSVFPGRPRERGRELAPIRDVTPSLPTAGHVKVPLERADIVALLSKLRHQAAVEGGESQCLAN